MTVKELIEQLSKEDQSAKVVLEDYYNGKLCGETVRTVVMCARNTMSHRIELIGEEPPPMPRGSVLEPVALLRYR